jgi:2-methylisocitrate lyase-like PEP mutase family enzyme
MGAMVEKAEQLRALHVPGNPLVLINVWDVASARVVADVPATRAIATASWSVAAAGGYADGQETPLEDVLALGTNLARTFDLPVSVDFEKGYADNLAQLGDNIRRLGQTGVVGLNIEDSLAADDGPCWPLAEAAARIACVRDAAIAEGVPLVINARTDVLAGGGPVAEAIERGNAYIAAGADCVFVLAGTGPQLPGIVAGINGPVSVLAGAGAPPVAELAAAGVARISVGPGAMGVAYAALQRFATHAGADTGWPADLAFRP